MTQSQDVFRKVGRGGAGNFVPAAERAPDDKDLEAQDAAPFRAEANPSGPGRAGRGGAGNVVDAAQLPDARDTEQHVSAAVEARLKTKAPPGSGMGGRGGAGNWASKTGAAGNESGRGHNQVEELERRVQEAVDKGLRMPEKVHHGSHNKGSQERLL